MPNDETATLHADGENIPLESSGPYREEAEPQINREVTGPGAPAEPRREGSQGEKGSNATEGTNPKNTENAKPD